MSFNEGSLLSPALGSIRTLHQLSSDKAGCCCWLVKPCSQSLPGCPPCEHNGAPDTSVGICLPWAWAEVRHCPLLQLTFVGTTQILSLVLHHYLHEAVSPCFCVLSVLKSILWISLLQLMASSQTEELLSLSAFQIREPAAIPTQDPSCNKNTQFVHIGFGISLAPRRHYGCMS